MKHHFICSQLSNKNTFGNSDDQGLLGLKKTNRSRQQHMHNRLRHQYHKDFYRDRGFKSPKQPANDPNLFWRAMLPLTCIGTM
jgi:hypothetical protein